MVFEEIDIDDANNNPHVLTNESSTIKHTNINNNDSNSSEVTNNTKKWINYTYITSFIIINLKISDIKFILKIIKIVQILNWKSRVYFI